MNNEFIAAERNNIPWYSSNHIGGKPNREKSVCLVTQWNCFFKVDKYTKAMTWKRETESGKNSLSLSLSDVTWNASVWAPRLWLIALRYWILEYAPLSYVSMYALIRRNAVSVQMFCKFCSFLDPEGSLSATTVVVLVVTLFEKCLRLC